MYTVGYMQERVREQVDALPIAGALAYMEFLAAVELSPWGLAGRSPGDANMPTVAFGPGGEGQVSYVILEDERQVWVTDVTWAG